MLWRYIRPYLLFAVIGALFMVGEVCMDLAQPSLMTQVVDVGALGIGSDGVGDMGVIVRYGLIMCACALIGVVCGSANNVFVEFAKQNVGNSLRKDAYRHIMGMSSAQVEHFGTGALITRTTNDITHIEMMVMVFVRGMIRTGLMLVGSIALLFMLNPGFGLIVLVAFPIALVVMFVCLRIVNPLFLRIQERLDRLNAIMQEDLVGIRTVKAFVREVYEKVRFGKANDELIRTQLQALLVFAFMNPLMNVLMYTAIAGMLLVGYQGSLEGAVTPGAVIASISYATRLLFAIMGVVMLAQDISRGTTSWRRVKEVLLSEPEIVGGEFTGTARVAAGEVDGEQDATAPAYGAAIDVCGVTFTYPGGATPVLSGIDLRIAPGEKVVIMGSTGCGKTTLASLIDRFYDADEGIVAVDGVDVRSWDLGALRTTVVPVLQRTELFAGSISDGVAWGVEGESEVEAGDVVERALRVAQAWDFVEDMDHGVESRLVAGGANLSGGQRQRISIARALAGHPRALILDDSTSALDTRTEARFLAELDEQFPGTTKVIVAQRISTARNADRIAILDEGHIVAQGTHEELLTSCAIYRDIASSQMEVDVDA